MQSLAGDVDFPLAGTQTYELTFVARTSARYVPEILESPFGIGPGPYVDFLTRYLPLYSGVCRGGCPFTDSATVKSTRARSPSLSIPFSPLPHRVSKLIVVTSTNPLGWRAIERPDIALRPISPAGIDKIHSTFGARPRLRELSRVMESKLYSRPGGASRF